METLSSSRTNLYKVLFLLIFTASSVCLAIMFYVIWFNYDFGHTLIGRIFFTIIAFSFIIIPIYTFKIFKQLVDVQYEEGYLHLKTWGLKRKIKLEDLQCEGYFRLVIIDKYRRWTFSKLKSKKDKKE